MKEPRKYPSGEEAKPLMASEPTAEFGTMSRTARRPMYHGATENIDQNVPEYMMSEEAYRYYHPEEKLKSLSEIDISVVSLKDVLKHGMSLEGLDAHLTRKIHSYFHSDE